MSGPGDWPGSNDLLSGLFGAFQAGAAGKLDTASVWQQLRITAGQIQYQASGSFEPITQAQLEANGAEILRQQGVGIQQVNTYRALAGQWLGAKQNLHASDEVSQVTSGEIFRPPWAQTADPAVPDRYRVRVNWQVTPAAGDVFTSWASYELTAPVTSIADALEQAGQLVAKQPTSEMPPGAAVTGVEDYEIEQV